MRSSDNRAEVELLQQFWFGGMELRQGLSGEFPCMSSISTAVRVILSVQHKTICSIGGHNNKNLAVNLIYSLLNTKVNLICSLLTFGDSR